MAARVDRRVDDAGEWRPKPPRRADRHLYQRWAVRTHLITPGERLPGALAPYLEGRVGPSDVVALSEKIVAISEGRAVPLADVKPGPLARLLAAGVKPLGYGIGLRRPETMEMAIREAGAVRIMAAAAIAAVTRLVGRTGDFYRLVGPRVASIDGPGPTTIPPYDRYIVLAPLRPGEMATSLARRLRAGVAVVDANDLGCDVLGWSPGVDPGLVRELLRDNPMGQGAERTPIIVLRPTPLPDVPGAWPPDAWPEPAAWPAVVAGLGAGATDRDEDGGHDALAPHPRYNGDG